MRLRLSSFVEWFRSSLFVVPLLGVVVAMALGFGALAADTQFDANSGDLPVGFASTVESARALLSTIAGATITFAGIAFSVSLLTIQQASNQYSPRVVTTLFRDPFNKRIMGLVVGTFTFCIVVLRSVRTSLEDGGEPVIPNLSVAIAVVLGIATILAVVAFIDHSAHAMDVSQILDRVRREALDVVRREWTSASPGAPPASAAGDMPEPFAELRFATDGWVQQFDAEALLRCLPDGGTIRLETFPGRYAVSGTPLCALSPRPRAEDAESVEEAVRAAVVTGRRRTLQQDVSYGLRQLVDVGLKALSPGVNDPTTAQDAIFHAAAVLAEMLHRDPPPHGRPDERGRRLFVPQQPSHAELVGLAFDELRQAAAAQPTVCIYLLESLHLLDESLCADGLGERAAPLREQARLVVAGCAAADLLPHDLAAVEEAYANRFDGR